MKEYIYYLICPIDGKVKYVGKTKHPETRYKQHVKKLDKLMTPKRIWLEGLFAENLMPIMKVVEEVPDGKNAREREQYHVTKNQDTILNIHNPAKGAKAFKGRYPKKKKTT